MNKSVWFLISLFVIIVDQYTKYLIQFEIPLYQSIELTSFFNLTHVHNYGAAFSFLSDAGGWQRWLFTGLAVTISLVIAIWLTRLKDNEKLLAFAFAMILGGALGNLIDRVYYGYVVDFLVLHYEQWSWPAFNAADSAISLGAFLMIWDSLFHRKQVSAK